MAILFPSDAWIKALSAKLNESESYERSANELGGELSFSLSNQTPILQDTAYLYLGLYHGKSPDAEMIRESG